MQVTNNLNLVYPENSNYKFETRKYPDGQQDFILKSNDYHINTAKIISRFNSFQDLELIICSTTALRNIGVEEISLKIPYLLGARSDRQFVDGGTSYLRDVVAPIINSMNYKIVEIVDPHSDVAAAVIRNMSTIKPTDFWSDFWKKSKCNPQNAVAMVPDAGALKRVYDFVNIAGKRIDAVFACSKHRDIQTGKILETVVPVDNLNGADVVIVDDICDGGKTFIEMAKVIKTRNCGRLFLIVTHGIFSKGLEPLIEYFDEVHCTNSYSDLRGFVSQHNIFN